MNASFDELKRFTSDASHEFWTPLAVVKGIGEVAASRRRTPAEYEDALGGILEETDRMGRLVDTLLLLARGDAAAVALDVETTDMGSMATEVSAALGILAEERNQTMSVNVSERSRSARTGWCSEKLWRMSSTTPSSAVPATQ